jgi:tRNA pseudouridine38-40 synthase
MEHTLALTLEYQGSGYHGFQVQPQVPTVQGELERALEVLVGRHVNTRSASRTDAGAHARGQVVAFEVATSYAVQGVVRSLNGLLPADIRVQRGCNAPEGFDPRRRASSREYRYLVLNRERPSALWREFAYHVSRPLDAEAMSQAAARLVGEHDFAAFSGPVQEGRSTQRRVFQADVCRSGELVTFAMEAEAFLPHQVRRTVGSLVRIGKGEMTVEEFQALMDGRSPDLAGPALPAWGLYLESVSYPEGLFNHPSDRKA